MNNMIEKYRFGLIKINGREYDYDVKICLPNEISKWQRKESHVFDIESVREAVKENPDIIIFGTGAYGMAHLTKEAKSFLEEKGVKIIIDKTGEAVKVFNVISKEYQIKRERKKKIIGLFHLTC